jgi:hypothetical protein
MALVTRKEFAAICGKSVNYINTGVTRNKITVLPSKLIDTDNPLNKIFKKNCNQLNKKATVKPAPKTTTEKFKEEVTETETLIFSKKETAEEKAARMKQNAEDEENLSWTARKTRADALNAERKAELAQLQVDKMMGSLMPVDLVEMIIKVNIQDIFKTFENSAINLASIYCDILANGDRTKLAELTGKLRHEISGIVQRVKESAAAEVENVIVEYAETRNRGEKK